MERMGEEKWNSLKLSPSFVSTIAPPLMHDETIHSDKYIVSGCKKKEGFFSSILIGSNK